MVGNTAQAALALLFGLFAIPSAFAATDKEMPRPMDILFDSPHLEGIKAGDTLIYKVKRDVTVPEVQGKSFEDQIKVDIKSVDADDRKSVTVNVFSGDRARDPQNIDGMTGNPVLVFFLDRSVFGYAAVAGGARAYLKNRFKIEIRDSAKIEPAKVRFGGQEHDGYRISIQPYVADPNTEKMRGYQKSQFEIVLSDKVPGHFVQFETKIRSEVEKKSPAVHETMTLTGAEVIK